MYEKKVDYPTILFSYIIVKVCVFIESIVASTKRPLSRLLSIHWVSTVFPQWTLNGRIVDATVDA